jgi:hypothetical protein
MGVQLDSLSAIRGVQESLFLIGQLDCCKIFPLILLRLFKINLWLTMILMNKFIGISSELPEQRARLSSLLLSLVPECGRKFQTYLEALYYKKREI